MASAQTLYRACKPFGRSSSGKHHIRETAATDRVSVLRRASLSFGGRPPTGLLVE